MTVSTSPKATYQLSKDLWAPQTRTLQEVMQHIRNGHDVCLQSPTGTGKTRMATELLSWSQAELGGGCFYLNRKILIGQSAEAMAKRGLSFGVRAADHEDLFDPFAPVQICSAPTEWVRVYGTRPEWSRHDCGLVIVDEAHIQKGKMMKTIIDDHKSKGANVVLLSATPVSLSSQADRLVVSGSMREYRDCGALVPAHVKGIEEMDMRKVKRKLTGEFDIGTRAMKVYTQTIVGNVIDKWKEFNPSARPTFLYAPGKAESVWFTQRFERAGVRWAHIDATEAWLDGKRYTLTRSLWQEILEQYTDGEIKGLSSRFKLREGIDVPATFHVILATPIGSIQSYLQTVGRSLRASPGKDFALVTDHGGNYHRHGSPNIDRDWKVMWAMSSGVASKLHEESVKNRETSEAICCPKCSGERMYGIKCPHCGYEHQKGRRRVIELNGNIKTVDGPMIKLKKRTTKPDSQRQWDNMYWGYRNKGIKQTFAQMEAFFRHQHGYWPDRNMNNMPLTSVNWHRHVKDVQFQDLNQNSTKGSGNE